MIVCHSSPSGVSGQFIGTKGTTGGNSDGSGGGDGTGGGSDTTNFGTFLFRTTGSGVLIVLGD